MHGLSLYMLKITSLNVVRHMKLEDERTALFSQLEIMSTQETEFPCDSTQSPNTQRFSAANEGTVSVRTEIKCTLGDGYVEYPVESFDHTEFF